MTQTAMQEIGLNYGWNFKADDWKPGMDANLVIVNGLLSRRVQAVTNSEPSVGVAPDVANAGKVWIVGTSPGAWATGKSNCLAARNGETATWVFVSPTAAMRDFLNVATGEFVSFIQGAWVPRYTDFPDVFPSSAYHLEAYTQTPPTPTSPGDNGKFWAVKAGATGVWAGKGGYLAGWYVPPGKATGEWRFVLPKKGWRCLCDGIVFPDPASVYPDPDTVTDFLMHTGSDWTVDPTLRNVRGPAAGIFMPATTGGVPWVYVLTELEASSPSILVIGDSDGSNVTLRYPASMRGKTPATVMVFRAFTNPVNKVTVDFGDGTEVPGTSAAASNPDTGDTDGLTIATVYEAVPDAVATAFGSVGVLALASTILKSSSTYADTQVPSVLAFTSGSYELYVPENAGSAALTGMGDVGKLLVTDEASANTVWIKNNPVPSRDSSIPVLKFFIAQKGAGATTIALDNTATGTNNSNDIITFIAPATMAQGESRCLRWVAGGGTGGAGDLWLVTQS